jgi:hypothetical protein
MRIKQSLRLVANVLPYVAVVIGVKFVVHTLGLEFITLNAIFSALIGANVFLLGFLISGVLSDYKESERLPGEIASILLTIVDEINFVETKSAEPAFVADRLRAIRGLGETIHRWLMRTSRTAEVMNAIEDLSREFVRLEQHTPANYIARLKQEQNNLRKLITRIHTIRETDFVFSGYFIASTSTILLIAGMVFLKIEPFYESMFFLGLVTYLLLFLLRLIRDLDNPFGQYDASSCEDVSIKPIDDAVARIAEKLDSLVAAR